MSSLHSTSMDTVFSRVMGDRPSAYLEIDLQGHLIRWGGELSALGFEDFNSGDRVEDHVDLLTGMLEPEQLPIELPFMSTPSGITTDIHLFIQSGRIWALFVFTEDRAKQQQAVQQRVNDLCLSHHRQTRILNQYLGREVSARLEEGLEHIEKRGERRDLTILFADIRGFSSYSEHTLPEEVFEVLNVYLGCMIPVILKANGVLDKIIGDEVMAIFGMLPGQENSVELGLTAALEMLNAINQLNQERRLSNKTVLEIGIGMATGPVTLGVLGSEDRKSITVIGNHVNLAARLQGQAQAKQLVIDSNSFQQLNLCKHYFTAKKARLKGYSAPLRVFQLDFDKIPELDKALNS